MKLNKKDNGTWFWYSLTIGKDAIRLKVSKRGPESLLVVGVVSSQSNQKTKKLKENWTTVDKFEWKVTKKKKKNWSFFFSSLFFCFYCWQSSCNISTTNINTLHFLYLSLSLSLKRKINLKKKGKQAKEQYLSLKKKKKKQKQNPPPKKKWNKKIRA